MTMAITIFHVIKMPEQKLLVCRQLLVSLPLCTLNCIPVSPLGFIRRDIFSPCSVVSQVQPPICSSTFFAPEHPPFYSPPQEAKDVMRKAIATASVPRWK